MNKSAISQCITSPVLRRSLIVGLVVGTMLVAINQGDAILDGKIPPFWKLALTYVVPFLVSTYGAYSACTAHLKEDEAHQHER